jgi:DNA-binding LacI/PurR family transcriptional regulator
LKSAMARQQAFLRAMEEIGLELDPALIIEGDHTMEGGMKAFARLLAGSVRPTAVLCSNDMTAIGVMRESHDVGISIPRDLSVIGFDDIRLAQFVLPPLTSVQMSQPELARLAFNALLAEIERETPLPNGSEYTLKTNLVLRESTRLISDNPRPAEKWRGTPVQEV